MYVIVNVEQGEDMKDLMVTLASKRYTFSVTDNISKVCNKCTTLQPPDPPMTLEEAQTMQQDNIHQPSTSVEQKSSSPQPPTITESCEEEIRCHPHSPDAISELDGSGNESFEHQMDAYQIAMFLNRNLVTYEQNTLANGLAQFQTEELRGVKAERTSTPPPTEEIVQTFRDEIERSWRAEEQPKKRKAAQTSDDSSQAPVRKDYRGACNLCQQPISIRSHHMRRHATKHLGFKTFQCTLCNKAFNRADLCKPHFERYHPNVPQIPFKDMMTPDQADQLEKMVWLCFPNGTKFRPPGSYT